VSRIDDKFSELRKKGRKAFIPFLTAGDPSLDATLEIVRSMEAAGADIIELGVPFSDPIADGPVIQRATDRALEGDVSLPRILDLVRRIRETSDIPLLAMSYYNPLLSFGLDRLADSALDVGLDGVLASDLTVEESGAFVEAMKAAGLSTVFLVAPTSSPERIERIAKTSTGFLYAVSRTGVTGQQSELPDELVGFIRRLREHTANPIAVGFGISKPEHVGAVWSEADGAVVGSAIVQVIEQGIEGHSTPSDLAASVGDFVQWLRGERGHNRP
jgi:tryptophan synthase alpha chain